MLVRRDAERFVQRGNQVKLVEVVPATAAPAAPPGRHTGTADKAWMKIVVKTCGAESAFSVSGIGFHVRKCESRVRGKFSEGR